MKRINLRWTLTLLGVTFICIWISPGMMLAGAGNGTIDATVYGTRSNGILGADMVVGDLNNDNVDDLIVNAPWVDCIQGRRGSGGVYIVFGRSSWLANLDLLSNGSVTTICGAFPDEQLGSGDRHEAGSMAIGDINGDGRNDLAIGAANADGPQDQRGNAGNVYVLWGRQNWPAMIDLAQSYDGMVLYGEDSSDFFGTSVAIGNLDGDAFDDLVVGAMNADANLQRPKSGKAFVWYGKTSFPNAIDTATASADFEIVGRSNQESTGIQVEIGQLDNSGPDDLLVSATSGSDSGRTWNGVIYAFYFSSSSRRTGVHDLANKSADWQAYGGNNSDSAGSHLAIGRLNNDGANDSTGNLSN